MDSWRPSSAWLRSSSWLWQVTSSSSHWSPGAARRPSAQATVLASRAPMA
jgi:hypothetical protein